MENTKMVQGLKSYWNKRSDTYSLSNLEELNNFKKDAWTKLLTDNAPRKEHLRVLDIGTGPGLFSILMALKGHEVTAVDVSSEMINHAKENTEAFGVEVKFVQISGPELPFKDNIFDLVICRNVLWNIEYPHTALKEWYRVLDNNGRIVYFDANWYLYLYDDNQMKEVEFDRMQTEKLYGEKFEHTAQTKYLEDLAKHLELSKKHRPQWDKRAVVECGFNLIKVDENIGRFVWDEKEKIKYRSTPMFMIVGEKNT